MGSDICILLGFGRLSFIFSHCRQPSSLLVGDSLVLPGCGLAEDHCGENHGEEGSRLKARKKLMVHMTCQGQMQ